MISNVLGGKRDEKTVGFAFIMGTLGLYAADALINQGLGIDSVPDIPIIESWVEVQMTEFCPQVKTAVVGYAVWNAMRTQPDHSKKDSEEPKSPSRL